MTELPFVGHLLTTEGLKPDPSKIDAALRMEKPQDIKGVRCIIEMVNYLTKFLKGLADLCEPLRKLTHKEATWSWTEDYNKASKPLKKL